MLQDKMITYMAKKKITVGELAEKTGIDEDVLTAFMVGECNELTVGMILDICQVLKCEVEDIFYM